MIIFGIKTINEVFSSLAPFKKSWAEQAHFFILKKTKT